MASSCGGGAGAPPSVASSGGSSSAASSTADHAVADALRAWDAAGYRPALVGQLRAAADALGRGRAVLRRRSRGWAATAGAAAGSSAAAAAAAEDGVLTESTKALAAAVRSLVVALEAERLVRERAEVSATLLAAGGGGGWWPRQRRRRGWMGVGGQWRRGGRGVWRPRWCCQRHPCDA